MVRGATTVAKRSAGPKRQQDPACPNCGVDALFYREGDEARNVASCSECGAWEGQPALVLTPAQRTALSCFVAGVGKGGASALEFLLLDNGWGVAANVNKRVGEDFDAQASVALSWVAAARLRDHLDRVAAAKQPARVKPKTFADVVDARRTLEVKPTKDGVVFKEGAHEVAYGRAGAKRVAAYLTRLLDAVDLRKGLSYKPER